MDPHVLTGRANTGSRSPNPGENETAAACLWQDRKDVYNMWHFLHQQNFLTEFSSFPHVGPRLFERHTLVPELIWGGSVSGACCLTPLAGGEPPDRPPHPGTPPCQAWKARLESGCQPEAPGSGPEVSEGGTSPCWVPTLLQRDCVDGHFLSGWGPRRNPPPRALLWVQAGLPAAPFFTTGSQGTARRWKGEGPGSMVEPGTASLEGGTGHFPRNGLDAEGPQCDGAEPTVKL